MTRHAVAKKGMSEGKYAYLKEAQAQRAERLHSDILKSRGFCVRCRDEERKKQKEMTT